MTELWTPIGRMPYAHVLEPHSQREYMPPRYWVSLAYDAWPNELGQAMWAAADDAWGTRGDFRRPIKLGIDGLTWVYASSHDRPDLYLWNALADGFGRARVRLCPYDVRKPAHIGRGIRLELLGVEKARP